VLNRSHFVVCHVTMKNVSLLSFEDDGFTNVLNQPINQIYKCLLWWKYTITFFNTKSWCILYVARKKKSPTNARVFVTLLLKPPSVHFPVRLSAQDFLHPKCSHSSALFTEHVTASVHSCSSPRWWNCSSVLKISSLSLTLSDHKTNSENVTGPFFKGSWNRVEYEVRHCQQQRLYIYIYIYIYIKTI